MKCKTKGCKGWVSKYRKGEMQYCENCAYEMLGEFLEQNPIGPKGKPNKKI